MTQLCPLQSCTATACSRHKALSCKQGEVQTRTATICWMHDPHSPEKLQLCTWKRANKTHCNNCCKLLKTFFKLCPWQFLTFQRSDSCVWQFLFKFRLTRDSFILILIPAWKRHISVTIRTWSCASLTLPEQLGSLHGTYCVLNDLHPAVPLFFGAGMHFHHFGIFHTHADQEQTFLFMSHFPYDELLQRDHCGFLVLQLERNGRGGAKLPHNELTF